MPDFPYINARVRAMRSRLLSAAQVEDLLGAPKLDAFMQELSAPPYGGDLQEAQVRYEGVRAVDEALARNLQRATRAILEFADGRPRRLIEVLLLRWDLANLRVVVRGKHAGRPAEEIVATLLPAGTLGEVILKEMAGLPDLAGLAGTLEAVEHPFAEAVADGVAVYVETKDLIDLELCLDRAYATYGLQQTHRGGGGAAGLHDLLQAEIDVANVKTALRLAAAGDLDEARRLRYYIPGGALVTADLFRALSAPATQEHAWKKLRVSGFPVKEPPRNLVDFEREMDLEVARALAAHYRGDPLGLDVVIGYLAMKSAEVANLRLIARGKFLGLPREQLRREMILV
ncbi:MAG: V-type ATPase subunit [Armatimonadota bacterium]|nr:V-type ATPase subunit [Armatimonadota bacterium]